MASTSSPSPAYTVHLLVLVHGMWGNPNHLAEMNRVYTELRGQEGAVQGPAGERLHTLVAQTNRDSSTYDGIDWGAERVAEEIFAEIDRLKEEDKTVTRISITGYSLGGLIGRYLVGVLYQRKLFDKVTPVNFTTVATPHIGMVVYPTFRSRMFQAFGTRLLSRTGEQFYAQDKWSPSGRPLLEVMADPNRVFFRALSLFVRVRFYANAVNDTTVPYLTSAIEVEDPFADHTTSGIHIELDEKYAPLIKSYTPPASPQPIVLPKRFSKQWFEGYQPPLPPLFQKKFPYNIFIMIALPVLLPSLLALIALRLSLDARKSRSRIRLLESHESYGDRLIHAVAQMEKHVEDAVVDYMDDPGSDIDIATDPATTHSDSSAESQVTQSKSTSIQVAPRPRITELQAKLVISLNTLPNMKKELVYIHPAINSHAVIVARDVKRFEHHKQGQGVLRHIADNFVI